jgi:RNA polymerase sigma factor (sigma-70 family)
MDTQDVLLGRYKGAVEAQNRAYGWELTAQQEQQYAEALLAHVPPACADSLLVRIVWCYHHDHRLVAALLDRTSLEGQAAWQRCREQLPTLLHYGQLRWDIDSSADQDDLSQIGAQAIFQALPQYHYHSRFSTWMFQVFRHSVLRALRDRKAIKRYGQTDSYDEHPALEPVQSADMAVESTAQYNALLALIDEILAEDPDQRLQSMFRLWTQNDLRLADIGRVTQLSQSRVSILLERARDRLRNDPRMQEWQDRSGAETSPAADSSTADAPLDPSPSGDSSPPIEPPTDDPPHKRQDAN